MRDHHSRGHGRMRARWLLVVLASVTGASVVPALTNGQTIPSADEPIVTGEPPLLLWVDDAHIAEGDSGTRSIIFRLRLSDASAETVTVSVATLDSTATSAGQDYLPVSLQVTFPPFSTAESLTVLVLGDTLDEGEECFQLILSEPVHVMFADSVAIGTIDNDDLPLVSIGDARIREGDEGTRSIVFAVRLSAPRPEPATAFATTFDGTARAADLDYVPVDVPITFPPGSTAESLSVSVMGDTRLEGNDWFQVRLSRASGVKLADSEATGTITNDERAVFKGGYLASTDYRDGTLPSAWGDLNADGYPDLPLYMGGPNHTFTEIPGFRELLADGNYHGASWCDYDRDGDLDLVILGYDTGVFSQHGETFVPGGVPTPTLLLQNQGGGTFVNVAPAFGMDIAGNGETAVWADFDGDGWPELFAPYYSHIYPGQSMYYQNNGDGTFTEQSAARGVSLPGLPPNLRPEGAQAADWDDDGDLDLFCASHFFINDGTGHFTDRRAELGLPVLFDEGSSLIDYDNDGDLDLYLRAVAAPRLFRNDAGRFTDVTATANIATPTLFWGDSWADVENDGDLDLVQHVIGRARLLLNQGDGTFERDSTFESASCEQELSAWADVDRDGDLDVVMGPLGKWLLVNQLDASSNFVGSHLRVRVVDAEGHETAHGATVRLKEVGGAPGTTQTRIVDGGSGYLGQNEYTVQFGVATPAAYTLEVVYPSPAGTRIVVDSLVNRFMGPFATGAGNLAFTVYRDGRVERTPETVAGVRQFESRAGARATLGPPTPSPARQTVSLQLQVSREARVLLAIHDLSGRLIRRLDRGVVAAGAHSTAWNLSDERGASVPTGVYFCRLLVDGVAAAVRRVVVVR